MRSLGLTPEEFDRVLRAYQRALVTDNSTASEPKPFLVARLRGECPGTAAKIEAFDDAQAQALWEQLSAAVKAGTESALWA
jgi:hypothetical protein